MKDTIKVMIEHPFSTSIVIGACLGGVASIITALKGVETKPIIQVIAEKTPNSTK